MIKLVAIPILAVLLLGNSGSAASSSLDLYGSFFKSGHPLRGERLEEAVTGKDQISNLNRSVELIKRYPQIKFEIAGHTDKSECAGQECHRLAQRRALLLYRFLLDAGVDPSCVIGLTEYATTRPITNNSEDSWLNRRAELNEGIDP